MERYSVCKYCGERHYKQSDCKYWEDIRISMIIDKTIDERDKKMDDEKYSEEDLKGFMEIFRESNGAMGIDEVHIMGRIQDFDDDQMESMIEYLLDNGFIHEPVSGYYSMIR